MPEALLQEKCKNAKSQVFVFWGKKPMKRHISPRPKILRLNKKAPEGTFLRSPLRAIQLRITGLAAILAFGRKNDHPGYPFGRAPWALITGVGPFAEIEVRLGEPYRAASSTRPRKRRAVLGTWPGLENPAPRAGAILPQVMDHFVGVNKMVERVWIPAFAGMSD